MRQHYTKTEYGQLLDHLRIVCQTNEQRNEHILDGFDELNVRFVHRSIPEGDYSLMIKACPELGFSKDTYFFDEIFIERKNSLQELAQSLYGQKQTPPFVQAVCDEMKRQKITNGLQGARIIDDLRRQYYVYDDAFLRELKRAQNKPFKYLLVEQPDGWNGILNHAYPNQYSEAAFWGMMHRIEFDYGLHVKFLPARYMAKEIYTLCKMALDAKILKT